MFSCSEWGASRAKGWDNDAQHTLLIVQKTLTCNAICDKDFVSDLFQLAIGKKHRNSECR